MKKPVVRIGVTSLLVLGWFACTVGEDNRGGRSNSANSGSGAGYNEECEFVGCAAPYTCEDYDLDGIPHCAKPGQGGPGNGCTSDASCGAAYECSQGMCRVPGSGTGSGSGGGTGGGVKCPDWTSGVSAFNQLVSKMVSEANAPGVGTVIGVIDSLMNAGCNWNGAAATCHLALKRMVDEDPSNRYLSCIECCDAIKQAASVQDPGLYFCQASCHYAGF